jgi:hypothetical protein
MKINKAVSKIEGGPSPVACVVGTVWSLSSNQILPPPHLPLVWW